MQVNSVSSQVGSKQNFGMQMTEEQMQAYARKRAVEFANLDDKAVRKIAYNMASEKVNDKKHKKISNAI